MNNYTLIYFTENDVREFSSGWPGANIPYADGWFEFDPNGDLVDISDNMRGEYDGMAAFSQDCYSGKHGSVVDTVA